MNMRTEQNHEQKKYDRICKYKVCGCYAVYTAIFTHNSSEQLSGLSIL